jgi:hypothetical protein
MRTEVLCTQALLPQDLRKILRLLAQKRLRAGQDRLPSFDGQHPGLNYADGNQTVWIFVFFSYKD